MRKGTRRAVAADYTGALRAFALVAAASCALSGPARAGAAVYRVDPAATVAEYTIAYLGVLRQHGRFATTRGTLAIDLDTQTGSVEFALDAGSVDTGIPLRDAFVRNDALLDAGRHPAITFVSTHLLFDAHRLVRIDGRLTLRGVTRDVSLAVTRFACGTTGAAQPHECVADAIGSLRRSDFGIDAYAPLIGDDVTLAFAVVGRR